MGDTNYKEWANRWNNALETYGDLIERQMSMSEDQQRPHKTVLEKFVAPLPQETLNVICKSDGCGSALETPEFRYWFRSQYKAEPSPATIDWLDSVAERENYERLYPRLSYDDKEKNEAGLNNARLALKWQKEHPGPITPERLRQFDQSQQSSTLNLLEEIEAQSGSATENHSTQHTQTLCPEGMIATGAKSWDGSYVAGCKFNEPSPPLQESDLACEINGGGTIIFHNGREECPKGMTALPNNSGSKRGNSR